MDASNTLRIGHGYDLHRLEPTAPDGPGRPFVLGGVQVPHDRGPVSHSDGDVLMHAVTDALLGAIGAPDIGALFPDSSEACRDAESSRFLREAHRRIQASGFDIVNMDLTVICERPKLKEHKDLIAAELARLLECEPARVNLKAKTHERGDAVGEGRAVEAHAVVLLGPKS